MSDGVEYFSRVLQKSDDQCPVGMSVFEWKRLKEAQAAERHLTRNESVVVRTKEDLEALMDRGEVFTASELASKRQAEEKRKKNLSLQQKICSVTDGFNRRAQQLTTLH